MDKFNFNTLHDEYEDWSREFGNGRNHDGLRFGQYLWNKYDLNPLFGYGPNDQRDGSKDGFSTEKASDAFEIFNQQLKQQSNIST